MRLVSLTILGYFDITVSPVDSSATNPFSGGEDIIITFARTGGKGEQGSQGVQGSLVALLIKVSKVLRVLLVTLVTLYLQVLNFQGLKGTPR